MPSPSLEPTRDPAAYAPPRTSMRRSLVPHSRTRRRMPVRDGGHFFEGTQLAADVAVQQERSRVASNLHDTVAQTLYGISLSATRVLALLGGVKRRRCRVSLKSSCTWQTTARRSCGRCCTTCGLTSRCHSREGLPERSLAWQPASSYEPDLRFACHSRMNRILRQARR